MEKFFLMGVTLLIMFTVANSLIVIFDEPLFGYDVLNCNLYTGACPTTGTPEIDTSVYQDPDLSVSAASLANPPGFIGMIASAAGEFLGSLLNFAQAWSRLLTLVLPANIPIAGQIVDAVGKVFILIQFMTIFWFVMKVKTGLLGGYF